MGTAIAEAGHMSKPTEALARLAARLCPSFTAVDVRPLGPDRELADDTYKAAGYGAPQRLVLHDGDGHERSLGTSPGGTGSAAARPRPTAVPSATSSATAKASSASSTAIPRAAPARRCRGCATSKLRACAGAGSCAIAAIA